MMFGGTLGKEKGGCTEFALSPNGKLLAMAISTGAILVYDTSLENFPLIRIYEGDPHEYVHLEFSSDNTSQLMTISASGFVNMYLMKGYLPPKNIKSKYVDPKKIIMHED
jgi:WD40 repeat protein